jgi:putative ATP-binding cassette transporter
MNWQTELNNSFYWLVTALFWVTFSFVLVAVIAEKK